MDVVMALVTSALNSTHTLSPRLIGQR